MNNDTSLVEKARIFAIERHGNQKYGDTFPYKWHLEKVANLARNLGYCKEIQAAAWLHDVVEDTPTSLGEMKALFGATIADIVDHVTFSEADKVAKVDKIQKAKQNPGAHVVKFCDSAINFSASVINGAPTGMSQWDATVNRYGKYLSLLRSDLPTPKEIEQYLN